MCGSRPGWRAAKARWRRRCSSRPTRRGDYAFLSLKAPAFDLTDRGVSGRAVPAGLDAFVYTERGVYRSGETVQVTALLRDSQGAAALGVPLTLVVERPDGVEYRRTVVPDQGVGGRALRVPLVASAPTGTWRVRAFADPKRPPVGEASFMVEDYVPDRLEFELAVEGQGTFRRTHAGGDHRRRPLSLRRAGRQARARRRGDRRARRANAPGFAGYQFGLSDEEVETGRQPLEGLPRDRRRRQGAFLHHARQAAGDDAGRCEAQVIVRMAEPGGRADRAQAHAAGSRRARPMIGVKPLFSGPLARRGRERELRRVVVAAPDGTPLARDAGCVTSCSRSRPGINGIGATASGTSSR